MQIISLVVIAVLTLCETGIAEICEKDRYDCENAIIQYGLDYSTTTRTPPCSNEAVKGVCPNYCKCISMYDHPQAGNILTECAAKYLKQLYLCKQNDLLKYYLNIPQAMAWFKEILDGSWFYASDRCTIQYVRSPNTQGDYRCLDSGYSYCDERSLFYCKTGGYDECYKECQKKLGVPCEPYVDKFVPPIGEAPQCFITWLNGASTTWYLTNLPRPVSLFVSTLKADQAQTTK